jgi:hypothetical protein
MKGGPLFFIEVGPDFTPLTVVLFEGPKSKSRWQRFLRLWGAK